MLLQDKCKPFFDAIRRALEKKGDMPRAHEALRHVKEAQEAVALVDAREMYLKEALTPAPGTICIYLEGDVHRPVRKRVIGVSEQYVTVEWHSVKQQQKRFDVASGNAVEAPMSNRCVDVLDMKELRALLASLPRVPA